MIVRETEQVAEQRASVGHRVPEDLPLRNRVLSSEISHQTKAGSDLPRASEQLRLGRAGAGVYTTLDELDADPGDVDKAVLAAASYRWRMASLPGAFSIRTSYNWRSRFNADLQNTPQLLTDAYGLVDANIGYDTGDWSVFLWGRNLANEVYADVKGRNLAYVAWGGEPRTYGIRFTARFPLGAD